MPQPFDYSIDVPDPTANVLNALKLKYTMQQNQAAQLKAQQEAEQQKMMQADLGALAQNPTAQGITEMMIKYPSLSENFKRTYDVMSTEKQKAKTDQAWKYYAYLDGGNKEMALNQMESDAQAAENAGDTREAKTLRDLKQMVQTSKESGITTMGMFLANAMGPEQFTENVAKLQTARQEAQLQSGKLTEQEAKAQKAATEAQFAESQQATDLAKKGWDITKIQSDIELAKDNQKIAAMNAQLQREQNQLKREELQQKIDDKKLARDEALRAKASELSAARTTIDNSISTVDRLLGNPELDNIVGSFEGSKFYPSKLIGAGKQLLQSLDVSPTGIVKTISGKGGGTYNVADKRADALADLETITNQSFINNLKDAKAGGASFGGLTEKEGEKLIGVLTSLRTQQSESQFKSNMKELQRLLGISRENLATKYGVPKAQATEEQGGEQNQAQSAQPTAQSLMESGAVPNTPNVQVSDKELQDILATYK